MSQLHTFHLWLCRHVRFNVESVVDDPWFAEQSKALPPTLVESLDVKAEYFKYDELVTPNEHGNYPDAVRLAAAHGKKQPLLLNDKELGHLESLTYVLIQRTKRWDSSEWEGALPSHYDRAVNCIQEIANGLDSFQANKWSSESQKFAAQLGRDGLDQVDGVRLVSQWVERIRTLLKAMGRYDLLPRSEGQYPTPTTLGLGSADISVVQSFLKELKDQSGTEYAQTMRKALQDCKREDVQRLAQEHKIRSYVASMREAIEKFGKDKPKDVIRRLAIADNKKNGNNRFKTSKQMADLALDILSHLGEYSGSGRSWKDRD